MARMDERLARAKAYLAIAESKDSKREAYKRAAKEIVAHKQETGETWETLARALGREQHYVKKLSQWERSGFEAETPFLMDKHATERAALSHTKRVLTQAPLEQVEQIIDGLPQQRKVKIAAAAHDSYFEESERKSEERQKTPRERRRTREFVDKVAKPIKTMLGSMRANAVLESLREAKEEYRLLVEEGELSLEAVHAIGDELEEFQRELEFGRQLVGGGE
jgi:hypothetical protein